MNVNADAAIRAYLKMQEANARYYQRHKDELLAKKREKYKEAHPNPRPVGRPRKVAEVREAEPTE